MTGYALDGMSVEEVMEKDYAEMEEQHRCEVEQQATIKLLNYYIQLLEAERDYYKQASDFAGVENTPWPKWRIDDQ